MSRNNALWIVAVIIVAVLLGCSTAAGTGLLWSKLSADDGGEDPRTFEYSVLMVNAAPVEMCAVYVSPVEDDDWRASWGRIPTGASLDIKVPTGRYDVLAVDGEGEMLSVQYHVNLTDATTWLLKNKARHTR